MLLTTSFRNISNSEKNLLVFSFNHLEIVTSILSFKRYGKYLKFEKNDSTNQYVETVSWHVIEQLIASKLVRHPGCKQSHFSWKMDFMPSSSFRDNSSRQTLPAKPVTVDLPALQNASNVLLEQLSKDAQIIPDFGDAITSCMLL
jgi:hypothetical protein